jgi:putative transposase
LNFPLPLLKINQSPFPLAKRHALYQQARNQHPHRWSGATRNWQPIGTVTLNPEREQPALKMAA